MIGNDAAWMLSFREDLGEAEKPLLELSSADFNAELRVTLPGGLEPGAAEFVIEGLDDERHAKLAAAARRTPAPIARLYLFWRDTNSTVSGYLGNLVGLRGAPAPDDALVAVLSVTSVTRRLGRVRYETHVQACERAWHRLATQRFEEPFTATTLAGAARELGRAAHVVVDVRGEDAPAAGAAPDELPSVLGRPSSDVMRALGEAYEVRTGKFGRGQLLIRDGTLYVGERAVPLAGAAKPVDPLSGLVEVQVGAAGGERQQFTLVLKGRPDLKPGDVVSFEPPAEAAVPSAPIGLAAAVAGELAAIATTLVGEQTLAETAAVDLYVSSVQHTLNRRQGFVTQLTGVTTNGDAWDDAPAGRDPAADPTESVAQAVLGAAARATGARAPADIGEVRAMHHSGSGEPPGQTLRVWRGLESGDARSGAARRLAVRSEPAEALDGVPYLTPFAWGLCGLVLPRYPGTRVALVHRAGRAGDPIEAGALWTSGHGPDSEPGDWWLTLPIGADERSSLADDQAAAEHTGEVSNDLIDADGNRVIEVGELTVRVSRDALGAAGRRPKRAKQDAITIEHVDGKAQIVISSDGKVLIKTDGELALAGKSISLTAKEKVTIDAKDVNVTVTNEMTVA